MQDPAAFEQLMQMMGGMQWMILEWIYVFIKMKKYRLIYFVLKIENVSYQLKKMLIKMLIKINYDSLYCQF